MVDRTLTGDLRNSSFLLRLFKVREDHRLAELAIKLNAGKKKGKSIFEVWMLEESDLVQGLAFAYGERVTLERFIHATKTCDPSLRPILSQLLVLYAGDSIERELGWFLAEGVLSPRLGKEVPEVARALCREVAPYAIEL